jgi:predicted  nucleic acid-binding Zn-ribbon protein
MLRFDVIKNLLEYQKKDNARLTLVYSIENSAVKREIDSAQKSLNDARQSLLTLEEDAKALHNSYDYVAKNLNDILAKVSPAKSAPKTEADIQSTATDLQGKFTKIENLQGQLEQIGRNINVKVKAFEDKKNIVIKAQTTIKNLTPNYENALAKIKPEITKIEAELETLAKNIDKVLLEKYKNRRRADKSSKPVDIVVPVHNNRCSGCFFEMPLSLTHKIATDGYIVCEECGRIIYSEKQ